MINSYLTNDCKKKVVLYISTFTSTNNRIVFLKFKGDNLVTS